jgi:mono/diheme cytochrome c family protein
MENMMKAVDRVFWCGFAISLAVACGPTGGLDDSGPGPGMTGVGGAGGSVSGVGGSAGFAGSGGKSRIDVGVYSEAVVEAEEAPPPIAGGTIAIISAGKHAAVSDPDHDQIVVIDLDSMAIVHTVPLAPGDDPGRLIEDSGGRIHVALRRGRGVAVVDPTGTLVGRLPVCLQPRGLAYDYDSDSVHVACAGGELVSYTGSSGEVTRSLKIDRDLRDVVIDGSRLLVSRFKSAELLAVENDGRISARLLPPVPAFPSAPGGTGGTGGGGGSGGSTSPGSPGAANLKPAVAWRTIPSPGGGAIMVHQIVDLSPISTTPGGYGGQCRKIIQTGVAQIRVGAGGWSVSGLPTVLPVDVATNGVGSFVAVASAARTPGANFGVNLPYAVFAPPPGQQTSVFPCGPAIGNPPLAEGNPEPLGRVTAVAFDNTGRLALQTREPAMFYLGTRSVDLPGRSRKHTGHELFHTATAGGLACASCHPEGGDDGQTWNFAAFGQRRTQTLAGGIAGTEPFHWSGDMRDFAALASDVFSSRMSGPVVQPGHTVSMMRWINTIPRWQAPAVVDAAAVQRGEALFNQADVACVSCHNGARLTNNLNTNVGTGEALQVPSLVGLAWRAPYMHNGCAPTLLDRFGFTSCGGGDAHGKTSHLSAAQKADLVAYLDTL